VHEVQAAWKSVVSRIDLLRCPDRSLWHGIVTDNVSVTAATDRLNWLTRLRVEPGSADEAERLDMDGEYRLLVNIGLAPPIGVFRTDENGVERFFTAADLQRQYEAMTAVRTERIRVARVALELLMGCLDDDQRQEFETTKSFQVRGGRTGRTYRINHGRHGNIGVVDDNGHTLMNVCCHPKEVVPDGDTVLAQKFMIESDEDAFLATANVSTPDGFFMTRDPVTGVFSLDEVRARAAREARDAEADGIANMFEQAAAEMVISDGPAPPVEAWIHLMRLDQYAQDFTKPDLALQFAEAEVADTKSVPDAEDIYYEFLQRRMQRTHRANDVYLLMRPDGLLQPVPEEAALRVYLHGDPAAIIDGVLHVGTLRFGQAEEPIVKDQAPDIFEMTRAEHLDARVVEAYALNQLIEDGREDKDADDTQPEGTERASTERAA
jgi:hypothetical protein